MSEELRWAIWGAGIVGGLLDPRLGFAGLMFAVAWYG